MVASHRLFRSPAIVLMALLASGGPGAAQADRAVRSHLPAGRQAHAAASQPGKGHHPAHSSVHNSPTRSLSLYRVHTGARMKTMFWANGHYSLQGMHQLDVFLRDEHNARIRHMDPKLIQLLWRMQVASGNRPIGIVSAFRSRATNHALRDETREVAVHSLHPLGKAADIRISGWTPRQVYRLARRMRAGGVGYYPENKFVHVDTGRIRTWGGT